MQDQSKGSSADDPKIIERAIVLELLRADQEQWRSYAELERDLGNISSTRLSEALRRLRLVGVIELHGEQVRAAACVRHLDALELICI